MAAFASCLLASAPSFRKLGVRTHAPRQCILAPRRPLVRCQAEGGTKDSKREQKVAGMKEELQKSGLTKEVAQKVLADWKEQVGHDVTPDDLRKVLTKTTGAFGLLLLFQTALDAGAAFGCVVLADLLGSGAASGYNPFFTGALSAVAYVLAGYYATGVFFDLFKLTALGIASIQFSVDPGAFLDAVRAIGAEGGGVGLASLDKARDAINMVKVLGALNSAADRLKKEPAAAAGEKPDLLKDLGAYLTLDRAQRHFGFDADSMGLSDAQAAEIAVMFSKFDTDDDGTLSLEEFKRLCAQYAPELSDEEVQAGYKLLDANSDGQVEFKEFVAWWQRKLKLPAEKAPASV